MWKWQVITTAGVENYATLEQCTDVLEMKKAIMSGRPVKVWRRFGQHWMTFQSRTDLPLSKRFNDYLDFIENQD